MKTTHLIVAFENHTLITWALKRLPRSIRGTKSMFFKILLTQIFLSKILEQLFTTIAWILRHLQWKSDKGSIIQIIPRSYLSAAGQNLQHICSSKVDHRSFHSSCNEAVCQQLRKCIICQENPRDQNHFFLLSYFSGQIILSTIMITRHAYRLEILACRSALKRLGQARTS
jgi:hypothetical protein